MMIIIMIIMIIITSLARPLDGGRDEEMSGGLPSIIKRMIGI